MQEAIFAILTDKTARETSVLQALLDKEFIAGAPWFAKLAQEIIN